MLYDFEPRLQTFREEVLQGLQKSPKELPSKYLYDEEGSRLFEQICEQEEYYLTRTEMSIMQEKLPEMVELIGPQALLIEYGSGNSMKTRMLLEALHDPAGYVPIDISRVFLLRAGMALVAAYPQLEVLPVCADYTSEFEIPTPQKPVARRVAYFPGSTIGNFDPEPARHFLSHVARACRGGGLLIGVDLKKDFNLLHAAYNDRQQITARFNRHLLVRMNRELNANFQLDRFAHYSFYNPGEGRIEMHLVSLQNQIVRIGDVDIEFKRGESIWTENSYKYTLEEFALLAESAGFRVRQVWTDPQEWFSIQFLEAV
ncbi:dimethylhistidine N-methyltransferase [Thermosporothrix hazakensis]|uniref:Dimethylhistidine N-methyltransferase n=2 Tax=Thermosporothrix TaxID=768650 RepID=A0A326UDT5_THEHA|nr:L-histidine N(alpha)-methyltransferase [Thermosporothrix hazakensis]PZW27935.1 dimethylhistidine N-methyltransferase [Thermosporothrix hazakensis]BBH86863.1 dimethylhistidine N-methyltransferase [Thermosporothrix sp. COM3]GCE51159.1 dimethylhistidine N-methyltransferase [Thermosporothrix hazakensis]